MPTITKPVAKSSKMDQVTYEKRLGKTSLKGSGKWTLQFDQQKFRQRVISFCIGFIALIILHLLHLTAFASIIFSFFKSL